MYIKWLNNLPSTPQDFLHFSKKILNHPLEDSLKLYYITLKLKAMSDSPIYKFLERIPYGIKFDEINKREYLLTLSVYTLRELLKEHLDLRLVKNLYLLLSKELPKDFLKGATPKHSILASQDILADLLTEEEKAKLPAFLKAKHVILSFEIKGTCEEIISIVPYLTNPYVLKKKDDKYEVFIPLSISEFVLFSLNLRKKDILKEELDSILESIKVLFPDCFGEI
ncbi:hypothetical protein [Thermodesulfobacterium hydrogeniphilum]|uniref:hypothetical protein n=1 Tax=Thermodesulfobacterium hydrogeniphilum TaxID=161156 RepID=UPI00056F9AE6|nr:hypothetical protein [Thermodesulfobacterium hydrogeniphilum]